MTTPSVGIFWGIPDEDGRWVLLADKTPVDRGEAYGDCVTHATGHAEFWDGLARLGADGLARRGLPGAPAWHPYEAFPRGRVVYWPNADRFVIFADPRLRSTAFIARVIAEFGLPSARSDVRSDLHYRPVRDL